MDAGAVHACLLMYMGSDTINSDGGGGGGGY